ncbi:MAG: hypothetical protein WAK60_06745 [Sedimentisphaerales bacterium]
MDISKFKDLIQKLSFLGNYSSLILPVIIMLIAVLLFIPTQLISSKLKKQIEEESISIGQRIQSLSKSAVSRNQWEVEQGYQQAYERDANQIALLAKQSSQRPLLSYKIFPEPKDTSTLIFKEFGQRFCGAIDKLITHVNALDCPTDAELQKGLQGSNSSPRSRGGQAWSIGMERLSEVDTTITNVLCREKAESASVYANTMDLSGYEFWEEYKYTGMDTAVEDCWYWQLAYWIIEDVFDTIGAMDSGSNSVFTSPVKRLLDVNFALGDRGGSKKTAARPHYVLSIEGALAEPPTGRFCNDDIDVVHFNVVVVVSTKAVLPFVQQLCSAKQHRFRGFSGKEQEQVFKHNQITVLESNIRSIDRKDATHNFYRYGEDAVVELDLICEYIFDKSGYDEIKPESVKKLLKKPEVQAGT